MSQTIKPYKAQENRKRPYNTTVDTQQKHHPTTESATKAINSKKETGKCTKASQRQPDDNPSTSQRQYESNTAATHRQEPSITQG